MATVTHCFMIHNSCVDTYAPAGEGWGEGIENKKTSSYFMHIP
jgi:hypothetical protein